MSFFNLFSNTPAPAPKTFWEKAQDAVYDVIQNPSSYLGNRNVQIGLASIVTTLVVIGVAAKCFKAKKKIVCEFENKPSAKATKTHICLKSAVVENKHQSQPNSDNEKIERIFNYVTKLLPEPEKALNETVPRADQISDDEYKKQVIEYYKKEWPTVVEQALN